MRFTKWIFFGYLAVVGLLVAGIGLSFVLTPTRDAKTYYVPYESDLKSLDPAEINDVESDLVAANIFECLYTYKYGVTPYELQPELAEGEPEVSADHLTVTVHIKKGVHFYDPEKKVWADGVGPEVKATDFVYSWKRVCDFHLASNQYTGVFQGHVVGIDDWFGYTQSVEPEKIDWDKPVEGLQAPDDYTFVIKLTQPYAQLRYNMAHTPTAVVSRDAVKYWGRDRIKDHPIGTGPYMLTEQLKEQRVVLEANPVFRGGPDVESGSVLSEAERLPHVKRVQFDYFKEEMPVWLLFRQGVFDVGTIPKDSFHEAIGGSGELTPEMVKDGVELIKAPQAAIFYFSFNMADPVVGKNKPLRQAMSMAFDRAKFIQVYMNGRGVPAIGLIPPGFATYDEKQVNPYTQFNLPAAKALLKEAENVNGGPIPPLRFEMPGTGTTERQYAEEFVSEMAALGLTVKVDYASWARFQEMADQKQLQIFWFGWDADYPDEQTFFQLLYGKNTDAGGINTNNYKNPEYDALYEKAAVMEPGPERDKLYRQMSAILMEDCPWVLIYYPVGFTLHYNWVHNLKPMNYIYGTSMYREIDFDARDRWLRAHK